MIAVLRQRNFALLWVGGLVSMLGDWMLYTALPIYVYQLTGSALATSLTFIAEVLPSLLFGSVAGVFVDRWDRQRVLVVSNVLLAASLLPLLVVRSVDLVWLVYVAAFVQTTVTQFAGPAENALLPRVVGEDHLVAANALNALNDNLARLLGPPLGGLIAAVFQLPGIAILDAATYLFAAGMVALVRIAGTGGTQRDRAEASVHNRTTVWHDLRDGLALIVRTRVLRVTFLVFAISRIGEGVFAVMFILWVSQVLGGGAWELGLLFGAQAIGGILGGIIVGRVSTALGPVRLLWTSTIMFGLLDLALFNYPRFVTGLPLGLGLMALVGVPAVGFGAGLITLRQTATEDRYRGRIFGAFATVGAMFYLLSTALMGVVAQRIGPLTLLNVQGGAYVVAGVLVLLLLGRRQEGPPHPTPAERTVTPVIER